MLVYLSLAERRAEIIGDEAIVTRVDPHEWGAAMATLVGHLKDGRVGEGMAEAVAAIGGVLAEHFPRTGTDPDEMPNQTILL